MGEMPEFTLDMFLNDGIFKDFPVFSGISTVYRVGKGFSEFAHYKKLIAFINAINAGIVDEQKRSDYAYKIKTNEQFRTREMEYIQVLIDRYIGLEKPQIDRREQTISSLRSYFAHKQLDKHQAGF